MQNLMVLQYILKQFCMPQNSPLPAVSIHRHGHQHGSARAARLPGGSAKDLMTKLEYCMPRMLNGTSGSEYCRKTDVKYVTAGCFVPNRMFAASSLSSGNGVTLSHTFPFHHWSLCIAWSISFVLYQYHIQLIVGMSQNLLFFSVIFFERTQTICGFVTSWQQTFTVRYDATLQWNRPSLRCNIRCLLYAVTVVYCLSCTGTMNIANDIFKPQTSAQCAIHKLQLNHGSRTHTCLSSLFSRPIR